MKRYVEIGSPWQTALSKLKYWGVDQPFATHENWSVDKISILLIKFLPNPNRFKTKLRKPKAVSLSLNILSWITVWLRIII